MNETRGDRYSRSLVDAFTMSGLTEEEAYFVLRFAGRLGYEAAIRRLQGRWLAGRQWLIWIGGWERSPLAQWDAGAPAWEIGGRDAHGRWRLADPTPISLCGHRFTLFGRWWHFKVGGGWLVFSGGYAYRWPNRVYWSPDGTPQHERARVLCRWGND